MHTVIITDGRATSLLADYERMFTPFLVERSGSIRLCRWEDTNADNIEEAVPGLYDAIKGHPEWRAIIFVHPTQEDSENFSPRNPFDFKDNCKKEMEVKENTVPLVRLTHMLAGFPSLGVKGYEMCYTAYDPDKGDFENCKLKGKTILQRDVNRNKDEIDRIKNGIEKIEDVITTYVGKISKLGEDDRKKTKNLKMRSLQLKRELRGLENEKKQYDEILTNKEKQIKLRLFEIPYDDDERDEYKNLTKKYVLKENRPAEVLLLSTRTTLDTDGRDEEREEVRRAWEFHDEDNSSDFWKVYPSKCRFLCYDLMNEKHTLYPQARWELCLFMLTLAFNQIPAQSLQAYWLYKAALEINAKDLERTLGEQNENLLSIQAIIQERMLRLPELTQKKKQEIVPDQDISVTFEHVDEREVLANATALGLTSDRPIPEKRFWREHIQGTRQTIDNILSAPQEIVADKALEARRKIYDFSGREQVLDRFQIDRIHKRIDDLETEVINASVYGLLDADALKTEVAEAGNVVRKHLGLRLTKRNALLISLFSMLAFFCGFIPYLVNSARIGLSVLLPSFGLVVAAVALLAIGGWLTLKFLRHQLIKKIKNNNKTVGAIFDRVNKSARVFAEYFSNVCTYMYARSLLSGVILKHDNYRNEQKILKAHFAYAEGVIEKNKKLCGLYNVSTHNSLMTNVYMHIDEDSLMELPSGCQLYELRPEKRKNTVLLDNTGGTLDAPYSFVAGMSLKREELYKEEHGDV